MKEKVREKERMIMRMMMTSIYGDLLHSLLARRRITLMPYLESDLDGWLGTAAVDLGQPQEDR